MISQHTSASTDATRLIWGGKMHCCSSNPEKIGWLRKAVQLTSSRKRYWQLFLSSKPQIDEEGSSVIVELFYSVVYFSKNVHPFSWILSRERYLSPSTRALKPSSSSSWQHKTQEMEFSDTFSENLSSFLRESWTGFSSLWCSSSCCCWLSR